ncbi:hypothetical protein ACFL5X_01095 [Candidatus Omnitrophota bacterium]
MSESDKLYERVKKDLILIPKSVRIVIDGLFAVYIFGGMVLYPIYRCMKSGIWGYEDYLFMSFGALLTLLFIKFIIKALKVDKKPA